MADPYSVFGYLWLGLRVEQSTVGWFSPCVLNHLSLQQVWGSQRYGRCYLTFPSVSWPTHSCSVLAERWRTLVTGHWLWCRITACEKEEVRHRNREKKCRSENNTLFICREIGGSVGSEHYNLIYDNDLDVVAIGNRADLSYTWVVRPCFHST